MRILIKSLIVKFKMTKNEYSGQSNFFLNLEDSEMSTVTTQAENELATFLGFNHFILTTSGLSSLETSLIALGVQKGQLIACDTYFPYAMMAIRNVGAIPVSIKSNPNSLTISTDDLLSKLHLNFKVVILTNIFGIPPCKDEMLMLSNKNIKVILDNCQGFGSMQNDLSVGFHADIVCYSFQAGKSLSCGHGGGCATNSEVFNKNIRKQISLGWYPRLDKSNKINWKSQWNNRSIGQSLRIAPIAALLLKERLSVFKQKIPERISKAESYIEHFKNNFDLITQDYPFKYNNLRWKLPIWFNDESNFKNTEKKLNESNIKNYRLHPHPTTWKCFEEFELVKVDTSIKNIMERTLIVDFWNSIID